MSGSKMMTINRDNICFLAILSDRMLVDVVPMVVKQWYRKETTITLMNSGEEVHYSEFRVDHVSDSFSLVCWYRFQ